MNYFKLSYRNRILNVLFIEKLETSYSNGGVIAYIALPVHKNAPDVKGNVH